jgi:four helix bundle protein
VLLIAEGANRYTAGQKRQRYSEARGESGEVAAAAELLATLRLAPQREADAIIALAGRVAARLTRLIQRHR